MEGAGSSHVKDRDTFLKGAVDASEMDIQGEDDRAATGVQQVRTGTTPYQGAAHPVKKTTKRKKKKVKKKTTVQPEQTIAQAELPVAVGAVDLSDVYEDPANPSLDDIERAKAVLDAAEKRDSPFIGEPEDHVNDPPEESTHTAVAEQFAIDDIDDETPDEKPLTPSTSTTKVTPPHLMEHDCGLPTSLMTKKGLTNYLQTHGISQKIRKQIDIQEPERKLYELYSEAMKNKRTTLGHFVAALRIWRQGFPINPKESVDINSMKVTA